MVPEKAGIKTALLAIVKTRKLHRFGHVMRHLFTEGYHSRNLTKKEKESKTKGNKTK